jgi:hypothetical protein
LSPNCSAPHSASVQREWLDVKRRSKRPIKLVCEALIKQTSVPPPPSLRSCTLTPAPSAIQRYGSEALLAAHLDWKKHSAQSTYSTRSENYREAVRTRTALEEKGNTEAAAAVVLAYTGRPIPKAFPAYPPILAAVTRKVDREVTCFAPRAMFVVGSGVAVDAKGEEKEKEEEEED